ncbi:HEAT repeat domain-containing protein [Pseudonocardia sp. KRD-184]|uniref:HEAT repeat domain-containing protein n=1 Tax=Pseudonocardia oceani TaxID=2792013 RepID=A0ABS6U7I4_9PSEU|nr:HEAT repeat domain-containing protein [Pseudonocardia oceani]MBW0092096.1 HEAT repeat domain-containing protein [Pseudonocardia oceani]MBW0099101.1 HEAT repeat domain-containing protein [Pseudonocardia oceani]MBW0112006.1 HEAT repeat domain-containing protein [Pseudonocardia oceani]MBW0122914.1 HEAT repeat domain-containing protein [Pseudonocardia oceani]MBW0128119.1 HEAT repeat domain-containing protein [Pseudonocardia oceani]
MNGLQHPDEKIRLRTAMDMGTTPNPRDVDALIERCGTETDFHVREVLTWALTRHPRQTTVPRLTRELEDDRPQARSQALHTLSKIGDPSAWPAITRALLMDPDDEVARSAWRAATVLVPGDDKADLTTVLITQLARGPHDTQRSLSRALVALDADLDTAHNHPDPAVRAHARATEQLKHDPEAGFAIEEATRVVALGPC